MTPRVEIVSIVPALPNGEWQQVTVTFSEAITAADAVEHLKVTGSNNEVFRVQEHEGKIGLYSHESTGWSSRDWTGTITENELLLADYSGQHAPTFKSISWA